MESLARMVVLLWLLSIALSFTALLFAVLYRRRKATIRGAAFWLIASAADIGYYWIKGTFGFVALQVVVWLVALVLTVRATQTQTSA